jgi:glycosyltransferase involved in cell wall biosynthesis
MLARRNPTAAPGIRRWRHRPYSAVALPGLCVGALLTAGRQSQRIRSAAEVNRVSSYCDGNVAKQGQLLICLGPLRSLGAVGFRRWEGQRGMRRARLGIVVTHPIQYQIPLFSHLSARSSVEPFVFFLTDHGLAESFDPGFGRTLKYDVPLLDGYKYQIVRNRSPKPAIGTSWGVFNPSLPAAIRRAHVDALLVHGYNHISHWLAYATAVQAGIPYLLRGDSQPGRVGRSAKMMAKHALLQPLIRNAGACLAVGERNREFYSSYGAPSDRIFFAPYSVDTDRFAKDGTVGRAHRTSMLESLGLDPESSLVLFAAKLQARKRPVDVVMAMDQLERPASLVVIGDGPLRPGLEELTASRPWMRMLGFVNQRKIAEWYGAADLFVLPSDCEPWGLAVNEAMAAGAVPLVSDAVGCAPDLVTRDVGWVYATGDIDALAHAISKGSQPGALTERRVAAQRRSAEYGIVATACGIETAVAAVLER